MMISPSPPPLAIARPTTTGTGTGTANANRLRTHHHGPASKAIKRSAAPAHNSNHGSATPVKRPRLPDSGPPPATSTASFVLDSSDSDHSDLLEFELPGSCTVAIKRSHTSSSTPHRARPPRPSLPKYPPPPASRTRTSLLPNQSPSIISLLDSDSDSDIDCRPISHCPPPPPRAPRRPRPLRSTTRVSTGRRRRRPRTVEVVDLRFSSDDEHAASTRTIEVIILSDSDDDGRDKKPPEDEEDDDDLVIVSEKGPDPVIVRRREKLRAIKLEAGLATPETPSPKLGEGDATSLDACSQPPPPRPPPPPRTSKPAADLPPVEPVIVNGQEEWAVSEILDSKLVWTRKKTKGRKKPARQERTIMYHVDWIGYPPTWEPAANLDNCQELIELFHRDHPHKPRL